MFGYKSKRQRRAERIQNLLAAARNNDVEGVEKYFMHRPVVFDACLEAAKAGAAAALEALLQKNKGFDFSPNEHHISDSGGACLLIEKARQLPDADAAAALMAVLRRANKTTGYGQQPATNFLAPNISFDDLQSILEEAPRQFDNALKSVGLHATDKLKFVLSFTPKDGSGQQALDSALVTVAERGDTDKAALLLKHGADANYAAARALLGAAQRGQVEMAALLVPHVDLALYGMDIAAKVEPADPEMAQLITQLTEAAPEEGAAAQTAREARTDAADGQAAPAAAAQSDTLTETRALPDGGTLTSVFCFSAQQQHNIVRTPDGGVAMTTVAFKNIDKGVIAVMKEKFGARAARAGQPEQAAPADDQPAKGVAARLKGTGLT